MNTLTCTEVYTSSKEDCIKKFRDIIIKKILEYLNNTGDSCMVPEKYKSKFVYNNDDYGARWISIGVSFEDSQELYECMPIFKNVDLKFNK